MPMHGDVYVNWHCIYYYDQKVNGQDLMLQCTLTQVHKGHLQLFVRIVLLFTNNL